MNDSPMLHSHVAFPSAGSMNLRVQSRRLIGAVARLTEQIVVEPPPGRQALVFAPHPDDETLGCGGTIIKKRRTGAAVHVVTMTNGNRSHHRLMAPGDLAELRRNESIRACHILGIAESATTFLDFPDTALGQHRAEAVARVSAILQDQLPDEIYLPYRRDINADHVATNSIVRTALRQCHHQVTVYEYPIWFWGRWPWWQIRRRSMRVRLEGIGQALRGVTDLVGDLRLRIFVGDVLAIKRTALEAHESQMTRWQHCPDWQILHDVAGGEFLRFLLTDYEWFYSYKWA